VLEALRIAVVVASGVTLIAVAGCSVTPAGEEEEETAQAEGAFTGTRNVNLKYEGTCNFLRSCSSYSRGLPAGQVMWGCTGAGACSDSGLWVAGPNRSYCGKTVQICRNGTCTNALVKDVSVSRDWEASNGVLDALDLPHGLSGRCSGFGGGRVSVTVGGRGTSGTAPSTPSTSPSPPDDRGGGCYSATLAQDVDELTCVQARSDSEWYQCKNGLWYSGVEGYRGRYGTCSSTWPL
jgi:hypothetical protein